jgi:hypothetical protein
MSYYDRWFNRGTGMELAPDLNKNIFKYTSENGTLFHAEYLLLKKVAFTLNREDRDNGIRLLKAMQTRENVGVYHRDLNSKTEYLLGNHQNVNRISKDNMLGILVMANILYEPQIKKEVSSHAIKNYGIFNNTVEKNIPPFNPATYFALFALCGKDLLAYLFFPFYIINMIVTLCKPKSVTSSRILYWMTLETLKKKLLYGWLYKAYMTALRIQYGDNPMSTIFDIYYIHPENPITVLANELKL